MRRGPGLRRSRESATSVLAQQQLGAAAHCGCLGLYILGCIADRVVMLALGAVLLLRPQWMM
jgi:hypothetical protein